MNINRPIIIKLIYTLAVLFMVSGLFFVLYRNKFSTVEESHKNNPIVVDKKKSYTSSLAIESLRANKYPGSDITIEQTLAPGTNYQRLLVSYISDGLKIYGLLTIPFAEKPDGGYPVILFNHGYIPPQLYSTTQSYEVMVQPLAQAGYVVFMPDYRGNGNSEGIPEQSYVSPGYVTDSMNALASVKKLKVVNVNKIGVLGHSMGGNITLHQLLLTRDFKAAVILAGVVGNENNIIQWFEKRTNTGVLTTANDIETAEKLQQSVAQFGRPQDNPEYWNNIDPTHFLSKINTPVQIQVGTADQVVPPAMSAWLYQQLRQEGKKVEYKEYPDADHNLKPDTEEVMKKAISYFDKNLK